MSRQLSHRLQIALAALLFSTGGAVVKSTTLSNWQVASFRSGVAAIVLFAALPRWRQFWSPRSFLVGLAYAATMILYVTGNKLTTAANTIFLQATAPIYLLLLGPLLLHERIRPRDLTYTAAMIVGMVLLFVGVEPPLDTAPDPVRGNIVGAFCGLSWALTILGLRWLGRTGEGSSRHDPAGAAVVAGNLLAALISLPLALPVERMTAGDAFAVVYLGVFQIGVAYIAMTRGVRHVRALEASLLLLLEPVLAAVWAWVIHGEQPGPWSIAGCLIILAASVAGVIGRAE
jgi:drug/metabolite transporter (DMT)-like permease